MLAQSVNKTLVLVRMSNHDDGSKGLKDES